MIKQSQLGADYLDVPVFLRKWPDQFTDYPHCAMNFQATLTLFPFSGNLFLDCREKYLMYNSRR